VELSSALAGNADTVWAHATSLEGINAELSPWLRMDSPPHIRDLSTEPVIGEPWFFAPVYLLGVLPYDRMHVTLQVLDLPGRRFVESSSMLWLRSWRHERSVLPLPGGCRLVDRLTPKGFIPGSGPVLRVIVRALFGHRHRQLRARFGQL
jgi:hypothetical protein